MDLERETNALLDYFESRHLTHDDATEVMAATMIGLSIRPDLVDRFMQALRRLKN